MDCESDKGEGSDFSDEDLGMLKRALHVEIPDNFDPHKIPENGEEYLRQVMYEAKKCPAFTVATVNCKKIKPPSELQIMENCMRAPKSMLPSMSWQDEAVEDFTKFRNFIFKILETHPKKKQSSELLSKESKVPKLSIVAGLSQEDKVTELEMLLTQMNHVKIGESLGQEKGVWIYSLLATLDTPLCPDTCHILREIARKCSQIRSNLTETATEQAYMPLNLYICVIARFFRQLDLADE